MMSVARWRNCLMNSKRDLNDHFSCLVDLCELNLIYDKPKTVGIVCFIVFFQSPVFECISRLGSRGNNAKNPLDCERPKCLSWTYFEFCLFVRSLAVISLINTKLLSVNDKQSAVNLKIETECSILCARNSLQQKTLHGVIEWQIKKAYIFPLCTISWLILIRSRDWLIDCTAAGPGDLINSRLQGLLCARLSLWSGVIHMAADLYCWISNNAPQYASFSELHATLAN